MQFNGNLKTFESGEIEVLLDKPDNLSGLKIKTKGEKVVVNFKGITTTLENEKIPNTAFFTLIKKVFCNIIRKNKLEFKQIENGYKSVQKTDFGDIDIYLNNNCEIKKIEIKNQGFLLLLN